MKKSLNIVVAGLGTVGSTTINLIEKNKHLLFLRSGLKINIIVYLLKIEYKEVIFNHIVIVFLICLFIPSIVFGELITTKNSFGKTYGEHREKASQASDNHQNCLSLRSIETSSTQGDIAE